MSAIPQFIPLTRAAVVGLPLVALLVLVAAVVVLLTGNGERRTGPVAVPSTSPTPLLEPRVCEQVTQDGVTFTFQAPYACGEFVNGHAWVAAGQRGSVVVKAVSPAAEDGRHGWMVNPDSHNDQAYDDRIGGYERELLPVLPLRAEPGSSIVKAVSLDGKCGNGRGHVPCLQSATVLTVLADPPPDLGGSLFRPPYFGDEKPLFSTKDIRTDLLPQLDPVEDPPSLKAVAARYEQVQLDHLSSWQGRYLHPVESFMALGEDPDEPAGPVDVANYGADLARDNNDAALRLMLDDPLEEKMPALVNYLQAGIDWYGTSRSGVKYHPDGGHNVGRKLPIVFAAVLLDDPDIARVAGNGDDSAFSENGHVYRSEQTGVPLFGKPCRDGMYDEVLDDGRGSRDCRDPLGWIDGGEEPGSVYQACCTSRAYQGSSLAARLLPGGAETWGDPSFHAYVDRWTELGAWTQPDPLERFPELHGTGADSGHHGSRFQRAMREAHGELMDDGPVHQAEGAW